MIENNLRCLSALTRWALIEGNLALLSTLNPDAIAAKYQAEPMLIRIVIGFICPENRECNV